MVLLRIFVVLACLVSVARAAPCKTEVECTAACDGGDPAACTVFGELKVRPLTADKLTADDKKLTACSTYGGPSISCSRFAGHLWSGIGVKVQRDAAIAAWEGACYRESSHWSTCLAYAKAIESTKQSEAVELYADMCRRRDIDLGCRAAGRIWTRVTGEVRGKKFSVELPSVMRHIEPWSSGSWHVVWSASTMKPDVEIRLEGGKLTCKAAAQSAGNPNGEYADVVARYAAKYKRLPADWAVRICASLRVE